MSVINFLLDEIPHNGCYGPLYVKAHAASKTINSVLIDLTCQCNICTKEFLFNHHLQRQEYAHSSVYLKTTNGLLVQAMGCIITNLAVNSKAIPTLCHTIPNSDQISCITWSLLDRVVPRSSFYVTLVHKICSQG